MSLDTQLQKIIKRKQAKLNVVASEIADDIKRELRALVNERWYDSYTPKSYQRTMELLDSITCEITHNGTAIDIRCGFDMSLIHAKQAIDNATIDNAGINRLTWNNHMSFDGEPFIEGLIELVEHGFDGKGSSLNPRRWHTGTHAVEDAQKYATRRARELLKQKVI